MKDFSSWMDAAAEEAFNNQKLIEVLAYYN